MYISKVELKNIKCFEHFSIDLEENGKPILWTMIVGDNSVGKSCLLNSIALGLCDEATAAALMKEISGDFLRKDTLIKRGAISGSIEIGFRKEIKSKMAYGIKTKITKKPSDAPERVKQSLIPRQKDFPWNDIFICGYGPQRAAEADRSYDEYDPLAAVYTLFNYESTLQNPELILRRQPNRRRKQWAKKVLKVLMLDENDYDVVLTTTGMDIVGPWGALPLWSLSDGYRSTIFWILDFLAWQIYFKATNGRKPFSGVLLIDEIEQHLHPKWQRYIVERLRSQFPKVQFITTTHSPLVALGISDIESAKIVMLKREKQRITCEEIEPETLKSMRADQVLTSDVFGLSTARSGKTGDMIIRFRELFLKDVLDTEEKSEFMKLQTEILRELPSAAESEEDRKIHREIKDLLNRLENSLREKGHDKDKK